MRTFEELVAKSIDHAETAEAALATEAIRLLDHTDDSEAKRQALRQLREVAGIHATLGEAYARLASAVIVNRTSLLAATAEPGQGRRES